MREIKTILVDDEAMALEVLKNMLLAYKEINIIGSYTNHTDLLKNLKKMKPDLIFLDIEMGEVSGLELAAIIMREMENVEIVFVTAYSQYAVDAFEINAIDYLLKPIQKKRLEKAIKRVKQKIAINDSYNKTMEPLKELKIYSFGGFQVIDDKENIIGWRTKKSKELFAYLWIKKERISSKAVIIDSVFPYRELDKASAILHTTIYQLRKSLEGLGYPNAIIYSEEGYQLNIDIKSDLKDLKDIIKEERYNEDDIGYILRMYKGDFLEEGYHWAMELQETYRQLIFKIIEEFAKKEIEEERFSLVLKISLDKLYEINQFSDSVVEMMIDFYGKQGERVNLEIFFKNYEESLWEEMRLKPTEKIIDIYNTYI